MRRVVLSAVPEPRRRGWLVPVLAGAAALVLAVALALILWQPESQVVEGGPPLPLAGEGRGEGAVVRPEKTPPLPSPAPQEREPPPSPRKKTVRPEPEPIVLAQAAPPAIPEAPHGQTQIQFSTPGGTRVIWVLQPASE